MHAFFALRDRGSTVRAEVIGGVTTLIAMACIIVVNPRFSPSSAFRPALARWPRF